MSRPGDDTPRTCAGDDTLQRLAEAGSPPADLAEAAAHAASCARCRAEVAAYRRLLARLSLLPAPDPGPAFAAAVMQQVARRPAIGSVGEIAAILAAPLAALAVSEVGVPSLSEIGEAWGRLALAARVVLTVFENAAGGAPVAAAALLLCMTALALARAIAPTRRETT